MTKDFGTWRLRLAEIVDYNHKHDSHPAFAASIAKTKLGRYIALNERSCHQSSEVLICALEGDSPSWIRADKIREVASKYTCVPCVLAMRRAKSVISNPPDPNGFFALPGQIVSIDPVGPITPKSISGFSLMGLVYDIGSSYQWGCFSDSKPIILEIFRIILADLKFLNKETKIPRSDAEEIFNSSDV